MTADQFQSHMTAYCFSHMTASVFMTADQVRILYDVFSVYMAAHQFQSHMTAYFLQSHDCLPITFSRMTASVFMTADRI